MSEKHNNCLLYAIYNQRFLCYYVHENTKQVVDNKMAYLYLLIGLFGGLSKGYIGRRTSFHVGGFKESVIINTLRSGIIALIGFLIVLILGRTPALYIPPNLYFSLVLSAVSMATFAIAWIYAYRTEAYLFLNVFTMLGSIVTAALGFTVYGEVTRPTRLIGMALLIAATYITSLYNKALKGKMKFSNLCLLIIGALGSAVADFSQKIYRNEGGNDPLIFTLYTYLFAAVLGLLLIPFLPKPTHKSISVFEKKYLLLYIGYSVCLMINSTFKTAAAGLLPASQMYPLLQGANLVLSAVMAAVLMKEKPTKQSLIGVSIALVAIVFMNL